MSSPAPARPAEPGPAAALPSPPSAARGPETPAPASPLPETPAAAPPSAIGTRLAGLRDWMQSRRRQTGERRASEAATRTPDARKATAGAPVAARLAALLPALRRRASPEAPDSPRARAPEAEPGAPPAPTADLLPPEPPASPAAARLAALLPTRRAKAAPKTPPAPAPLLPPEGDPDAPPPPDLTPPAPEAEPAPPRLIPADPVRPTLAARLKGAVSGAATHAADAVWAPACALCRAEVQTPHGLCAECWKGVEFIASPLCRRCGAPVPGASDAPVCDACLHVPLGFDRARSATVYAGGGRKVAMALKHGDRLDLARPAAAWMRRAAWALLAETDLLVPVPLHWTRFLKRRFNQSAELARALQTLVREEGPHPAPDFLPDLLRRTRATPSQGRRSRAERRANMAGAFAPNPAHAARLKGARVLLVDDVMTTGATLSACAEVLRAGGAASVDAVCLSRVAPREGWAALTSDAG